MGTDIGESWALKKWEGLVCLFAQARKTKTSTNVVKYSYMNCGDGGTLHQGKLEFKSNSHSMTYDREVSPRRERQQLGPLSFKQFLIDQPGKHQ